MTAHLDPSILAEAVCVTPPPLESKQDDAAPAIVVDEEVDRRCVRFAPETVSIPIPSPIDILIQEAEEMMSQRPQLSSEGAQQDSNTNSSTDDAFQWKHILWYQPIEMLTFRWQVRDICRRLRCLAVESRPSMSWGPQSRGLESRSCSERQKRKLLTTQFVLRVSSQMPAERLAQTLRRMNAWAETLAAEEGARDFQRAYRDDVSSSSRTAGVSKPPRRRLRESESFSDAASPSAFMAEPISTTTTTTAVVATATTAVATPTTSMPTQASARRVRSRTTTVEVS